MDAKNREEARQKENDKLRKMPCENLNDILKIEFIKNNWDKLTLEKLESLVKNDTRKG